MPAAYLTSDACNSGGAAVFRNDWFYTNWLIDCPEFSSAHINIKELFTAILAAKRWAESWRDKHIILYTDSKCAMFMINNGTSRNSMAMSLLRNLFWLSATFNFHITRHIAGSDNILSDFISRLDEHPNWQQLLANYHLPIYDPSRHMSYAAFVYLQGCRKLSGPSWKESAPGSKMQPMLNQPRPLTHQCAVLTSDFASTSTNHRPQPQI